MNFVFPKIVIRAPLKRHKWGPERDKKGNQLNSSKIAFAFAFLEKKSRDSLICYDVPRERKWKHSRIFTAHHNWIATFLCTTLSGWASCLSKPSPSSLYREELNFTILMVVERSETTPCDKFGVFKQKLIFGQIAAIWIFAPHLQKFQNVRLESMGWRTQRIQAPPWLP